MTATETKNKPPVAEIREGTVRIAIWERSGSKGVFYTAGKPEVSYEKDGAWKESSSYDDFDLECLALASLEARKKIRQLRSAADKAGMQAQADAAVPMKMAHQ